VKIALLGGESAGAKLFDELVADGRTPTVVATEAPQAGSIRTSALWARARAEGVSLWASQDVRGDAFLKFLTASGIDVLLCVRFRFIVSQPVLRVPKLGSFNLHTGPLPRYAGLNVCSWAIFNGETTHGVTLHEMAPKIDGGAIVFRDQWNMDGRETGASLTEKSVRHGLPLFAKLLNVLERIPETLPRERQDPAQRCYYGRLVPESGIVDWHQTAVFIDRFVRAADFYPFPSPWGAPSTTLGAQRIGLIKVEPTDKVPTGNPGYVESVAGGSAYVACGDLCLRVDLVERDGDAFDASELMARGDKLGST